MTTPTEARELSSALSTECTFEQMFKAAAMLAEYAALLEQAQPVAWRCTDGEGGYELLCDEPSEETRAWSRRWKREWEPLYAAPAPAVPRLTDEQATAIVQSIVSSSERPIGMVAYGLLVARAIERKVRGE